MTIICSQTRGPLLFCHSFLLNQQKSASTMLQLFRENTGGSPGVRVNFESLKRSAGGPPLRKPGSLEIARVCWDQLHPSTNRLDVWSFSDRNRMGPRDKQQKHTAPGLFGGGPFARDQTFSIWLQKILEM